MPDIQSPRGTRDILPAQQPLWQHVKNMAEATSEQMGFKPITVPTYEYASLFNRSIGEGTDIMDKELFVVRGARVEAGNEEYVLRPEGTAGIVRSYIEHGMQTLPQPVKLYSIVNNFRYDRPQKGRYREHVQVSIEYFGDASAFSDAWVIYTTYRYLMNVGLSGMKLQINTLGTAEERIEYIEVLRAALRPNMEKLSSDSQKRLETNPMRILDSKDEADQALLNSVQNLRESLGDESLARYAEVLTYLDAWNIPYEENHRLVRGLDYYSHTAFEWVIDGHASSLGGGGRYDTLVQKLGGPATPAVGAGLGLDRIVEALEGVMETEETTADIFYVAADGAGRMAAPELIGRLLDAGFNVDTALGKDGMGPQLKTAGKLKAYAALIVGSSELEKGQVQLKVLESGNQHIIKLENLEEALAEYVGVVDEHDHNSAQ
jgi:histidyl-tRNA synthetase